MSDRRIADWELERLALGELPAERLADARARVAAEPGGAERLALLAESNKILLAAYPPAAVAAEVARRIRTRTASAVRRRWTIVLAGPALAAAAVLLVARSAPDDGVRLKGLAPQLFVHRQRADGAERLADGAVARSGDVLQLAYVAAGRTFGAVVSLDGRGSVTLHLPLSGTVAAPLAPSGLVSLTNAYRLDDAPRFERFFLVTGRESFTVVSVVEAARALALAPDPRTASLALPPGLEQASLAIGKAP